MAERPVGVTDQASGAGVAQVRTRERTVGGEVVSEQYVIPVAEYLDGYISSYRGMVTTFRTAGVASANWNFFTAFNKTASTKILAIRQVVYQVDDTGALLTVAPLAQSSRITSLPTGGTVLTPVPFDTALSHDTNCEFMGATASDGGVATAITSTAGTRAWANFKMRAATQVGQLLYPDELLLPELCGDTPILLRASEGLNFQMVQATVTTSHFVACCLFDELVAA